MKTLCIEKITELQQNPTYIRNICILAHVDHGKTTLADTLVASNGIISQRMAGKLRYLDSREDEQIRGITMKSSAISLIFKKGEHDTLINLIDSPGHIDFSSEVSTAVRLCEGAIVLVDVVEGVCPQTHAVLRQAWLENIKPVLVLNKIDRLILELKMSPLEAHLHLQQILEQVNAITGELFTSHVLEKTSTQTESAKSSSESNTEDQLYDWSSGLEETDDSNLYFSPDQGNVIFASAIDGWGFGIDHFADIYATKLGLNAAILKKYLWGDFYLENKTKRIKKGAQQKAKKPLFVNFILENLWAVYEAVMQKRDKEMIEKIVKSMNLKIPPRDSKHSDSRVLLQSLCSQWLPLSKAVLSMVVDKLPSPLEMEAERAEKLLCKREQDFETLPKQTKELKKAFLSRTSQENENDPVVVYVSKLFPVERKYLPKNKQRPLTHEQIAERRELARKRHAEKLAALNEGMAQEKKDEGKLDEKGTSCNTTGITELIIPSESGTKQNLDDQVFVAFARVFSGILKKGQKLYVLGPKHDPAKGLMNDEDNSKYMSEFIVEDLYLFMGRELEELNQISAGNIVGIGGLEEHVLKSATLSDTVACPSFCEMFFEAAPIVRVAVEPTTAGDIERLNNGLKLLNQADPSVEILIQENGEHVVIAAGEVHLQKCLDDLRDRFAKIEVNVSSPIVPFRETIIPIPKFDRRNEAIQESNLPTVVVASKDEEDEEDQEVLEPGLVEIQTANRLCSLKIQALPLPSDVIKVIESNSDLIKILDKVSAPKIWESQKGSTRLINAQIKEDLYAFKKKLEEAFIKSTEESSYWKEVVDQIWCFGPRRNGPNILINRIPKYTRPSLWACLDESEDFSKFKLREFDYCIASGFQMATLSGPLCEESMYGVCFVIESWEKYTKAASLKERRSELKDLSANQKQKEESLETLANNGDSKLSLNGSNSMQHLSTENSNSSSIECVDSSYGKDIDTKVPDVREEYSQDDNTISPPNSPTWQQSTIKDVYGPFSGQLMSTMKEGCRRAFQTQPQRLMWAMYTCVIQATADVLGKMYGVLSKRHGRILHEDMKEGSSIFNIDAVLPVVESFGFAEEIRKKTSGLASPQLKFSHWEVIDLDPFWVPTTEEEYMHFGEKADSENVARKYMNSIRRRKGLSTDDKLVEFAEKQRTLKKNK